MLDLTDLEMAYRRGFADGLASERKRIEEANERLANGLYEQEGDFVD